MSSHSSSSHSSNYRFYKSVKFGHHEIEYVPGSVEAKVPHFLASNHMKTFPTSVEFYDKYGNMIEVSVLKSSVDCYFTNGWDRLADVYDLRDGGRIRLVLVRFDRIFIDVFNRMGISLCCEGPRKFVKLGQEVAIPTDDFSNGPLDHSVYLGHTPISVYTLHKKLLPEDISTIYLHLPMDFCQAVVPDGNDVDGTIIDPYGNPYQGALYVRSSFSFRYGMLRGWFPILKEFNFVEGVAIRVEIPLMFRDHIFISFD